MLCSYIANLIAIKKFFNFFIILIKLLKKIFFNFYKLILNLLRKFNDSNGFNKFLVPSSFKLLLKICEFEKIII